MAGSAGFPSRGDYGTRSLGTGGEPGMRSPDALSSVAERAGEVASSVADRASDLAATVRAKASEAGTAVADTWEAGRHYVEERGVGGMVEDLTRVIRRNPIPALLISFGLGFMLARSIRR